MVTDICMKACEFLRGNDFLNIFYWNNYTVGIAIEQLSFKIIGTWELRLLTVT